MSTVDQSQQETLRALIEQWQAVWGGQQAHWLESFDYMRTQTQTSAHTVLAACEQLQQSLKGATESDHQALQTIIEAQAFADLNGQVLTRIIEELRGQHEQMQAWLGEYHNQALTAEQLEQGAGPASSSRRKEDSVTSQQEADDLLAKLGL